MRPLDTALPLTAEIVSTSAVQTGKEHRRSTGRLARTSVFVLSAVVAAVFAVGGTGCATAIEAAVMASATPLMREAEKGNTEAVRRLIEQGADVNAREKMYDSTALMFAAGSGKIDTVRLLLENGADINAKNKLGSTALMLASMNGRTEVARLLAAKGADANAMNKYGATALDHAGERNRRTAAELRKHGAVTGEELAIVRRETEKIKAKNQSGEMPQVLLEAAQGHKDALRLLIERGADINARDKDGKTALMLAVQNRNADLARALLKNGARIEDGASMLMAAVDGNAPQTAKALIDYGTDVNIRDRNGMTALMRAVEYNVDRNKYNPRIETVRMLLEKGADINLTDARGWTALDYVEYGEKDAVASEKAAQDVLDEIVGVYEAIPVIGKLFNAASNLGGTMTGTKVKKEDWAEAKRILVAAGATKSGAGLQAGEKSVVAANEARDSLLQDARVVTVPAKKLVTTTANAVKKAIAEGAKAGSLTHITSSCANGVPIFNAPCRTEINITPPDGVYGITGQGSDTVVLPSDFKPGEYSYNVKILHLESGLFAADKLMGMCSGSFYIDSNVKRVVLEFRDDSTTFAPVHYNCKKMVAVITTADGHVKSVSP